MRGVAAVTLLLIAVMIIYLHFSERFAFINGHIYRSLGWDRKSAEMFEKGCAANNVQSCMELGKMYEEGNGVEQNLSKARQRYQTAHDLGFSPAQPCLERLNGVPDSSETNPDN